MNAEAQSDGADAPYAVAVIGGATAGAEIASRLASLGVRVTVFDQNPRPYGKIEDGLPRWHDHLREKEYGKIRERLEHPRIQFVPSTRIGGDVDFADLVERWGFSCVVLANGAWRDRPLPIAGADAYVGKGLLYQNPFIHWFNHFHEPGYDGPHFEAKDDALVVGGGLASIDVAKACMLQSVRGKLAERGIAVELVPLEAKGIPATLAAHGLKFEDLGLERCTVFYRRRIEDMPVVQEPEGADEERRAKARQGRVRLVEKACEKYCFQVEPLSSPVALWIEDGRVVGLELERTAMVDGRPRATGERFTRRGSLVVSSIGSIPEPIVGIEMNGELYRFRDDDLGRMDRFPTVFAAGNVVTGKGNIIASRKHAEHVAEEIAACYLRVAEREMPESFRTPAAERGAAAAAEVARFLENCKPLDSAAQERVAAKVRERQAAVGFAGSLSTWLERVAPVESC